MLIDSPRITPIDRAYWREIELADKIEPAGFRHRHESAIDAVRSFGGDGVYCGVSWGKDSVANAAIVLSVWPRVPLVHIKTINENPDSRRVRDEFLTNHSCSYFEIDADYGSAFTQGLNDDDLKKATDSVFFGAFRLASSVHGKRYFSGIRKDESLVRRIRHCVHSNNSLNTSAPISNWTTSDVFHFLETRGLPVHPAYAMTGGGRWKRHRIRVAGLGEPEGRQFGREEWEREYYGEELRRISALSLLPLREGRYPQE